MRARPRSPRLLLACLLASVAIAQDAPDTRASETRATSQPLTAVERVAEIETEFRAAVEAWQKAYAAAKTPEERENLAVPKPDLWHPRLFAIAEEDNAGPGGEAALYWITRYSKQGKDFVRALNLLSSDHLLSPTLTKGCDWVEDARCPEGEAFLRKLMTASPHREVRALATYTLAKLLKQLSESAAFLRTTTDAELLKLNEKYYGREEFERRKAADPTALAKDAETLFVQVTEQYADVPRGRGRTLGPRAEGFLFEMRNLQIGKVAPEIEGEDVDGKPMKLSDFRGKVVVLDFWGHW
jgi:hypothetical protein